MRKLWNDITGQRFFKLCGRKYISGFSNKRLVQIWYFRVRMNCCDTDFALIRGGLYRNSGLPEMKEEIKTNREGAFRHA